MTEPGAIRVVRSSPGRLRVHAPALSAAGPAGVERIGAAGGVRSVQLSPITQNLLIEFDHTVIDEPRLLALVAGDPAVKREITSVPAEAGWLRAEHSQTIRARPADCLATLLAFERYPEWQAYVIAVRVDERDRHGRGVRVRTRAEVAERAFEFTAAYSFPSSNRVLFVQEDGELAAVRGSWAFRSTQRGRTRATCTLEVKPSRRLGLLLRGGMYERARDAVLGHLLDELRVRVEAAAS